MAAKRGTGPSVGAIIMMGIVSENAYFLVAAHRAAPAAGRGGGLD
jgi:hypothetical protein